MRFFLFWRSSRFNPRTRTGCDGDVFGDSWTIYEFQSTHPHGVRPNMRISPGYIMMVSIHAPARGATGWGIFALLTGSSFNPRTRTGCDEWPLHGIAPCVNVSIHAPARGATPPGPLPRAPAAKFQSTHPHGVRRRRNTLRGGRPCFNPRTRTGCDSQERLASELPGMFQSTHPHGVRPMAAIRRGILTMFQSTHPHGVRRLAGSDAFFSFLFQSTHPHGVRLRPFRVL